MKKLLCAIFALVCFANSHANLIENGDFSNSTAGFGFSDAPPDTLNIRISPVESGGNSLTYSAKAAQLGGLNFSEVKIDRSKDYVFKFRAKASKKTRIRLILMADDINYIYRREIAQFKLDENWKDFSYALNLKHIKNVSDWFVFRIEKLDQTDADLSFANFDFSANGETAAPKKFSANIKFSRAIPEKPSRLDSGSPAFDKKEGIAVEVSVFNPTADAKKLDVFFRNASTRETSGNVSFDAPAGTSEKKFNLRAPSKNGVYEIVASLGGEDVGEAGLAVTPRVRAKAGDLPVDIGYCGVVNSTYGAATSASDMAFLADTGISYLRLWSFGWYAIEPRENEYRWTTTDAEVNLALEQGLNPLPVIGGMFFTFPPEMHRNPPPDWLEKKSEYARTISCFERQGRMALKPMPADWERMMLAVAKRYRGRVQYYEIMNEPNILWRDFSTYYPYLKSAYEILKRTDPNNKVVGFCTTGDYAGDINGFLATMLKMGAAKYCDAISFHSYDSLYEDTKSAGDAVIDKFREDLAKYGVDKPLWHTELFYLNPRCKGGGQHDIGPVFHAGYLIRRYLLDAASGVKVSTLLQAEYVAMNDIWVQKTRNFSKGLKMPFPSITNGLVPNEKFIVSAVFAQQLFGMKFAGRQMLKERFLCYKFASRDSSKCAAAIFALDAVFESADLNFNFPKINVVDTLNRKPLDVGKLPPEIRLFDVFGNDIADGGNGATLPISPAPVYIQADDAAALEIFLKRLM